MTRREWLAPGILICMVTTAASLAGEYAVDRYKGNATADALRDLKGEVSKQSGDQRSTREALDRLSSDVAAIRSRVKDPEVIDLEISTLRDTVKQNKNDEDFEIAKLNKWRDDTMRALLKRGIIE